MQVTDSVLPASEKGFPLLPKLHIGPDDFLRGRVAGGQSGVDLGLSEVTDTTSVENLLQTTDHPRDRHLFGPGPKRVLSFDGGGVRGAISVAFLERIEKIFSDHQRKLLTDYIAAKEQAGIADEMLAAARRKLNEPFRLADWFDLVGGTSTGALIAGAVALGYNTEHIKSFYVERAPFIFQKPFWRIPGLQAKFDARALQKEIDLIVENRTLGSSDLITGLSVVTKRIDTGSPWILTNNPRSPYWESKPPNPEQNDPGYIGNRLYRLGMLVRASTAAPHYFDPGIVQIIAEEEKNAGATTEVRDWLDRLNERLGRFPRLTMLLTRLRAMLIAQSKGPNPNTLGLFVDGGVTPFNNPSLALLMQVVLKPYGICWPLGPDKLTCVSIGTGTYRTKLSFQQLGWSRNLKIIYSSLMSMMGDTQTLALTQMQWLGECPAPWKINSEIGDLADELPLGQRWFRFMRYDLGLERPWFKDNLKLDLSEDVVAGYRDMADPSIIQVIYEHAAHAASEQVQRTSRNTSSRKRTPPLRLAQRESTGRRMVAREPDWRGPRNSETSRTASSAYLSTRRPTKPSSSKLGIANDIAARSHLGIAGLQSSSLWSRSIASAAPAPSMTAAHLRFSPGVPKTPSGLIR